jgi:hypothetical protein
MPAPAARSVSAYTYADLATATLIRSKLAGVVDGRDAMAPQAAWQAMVRQTRNGPDDHGARFAAGRAAQRQTVRRTAAVSR